MLKGRANPAVNTAVINHCEDKCYSVYCCNILICNNYITATFGIDQLNASTCKHKDPDIVLVVLNVSLDLYQSTSLIECVKRTGMFSLVSALDVLCKD